MKKENHNFRKKDDTTIRSEGGFTLVETLVAITVLLVAIAGPLTLANDSLVATRVARERLTASMLAQEGIEYIRFRRGNNFLQGSNWMSGLALCRPTGGGRMGCRVDIPNGTIRACWTGCDPLTYNTTTNQYGYTTSGDWVVSPYTREVSIIRLGDESVVRSEVRWRDGTTARSVVAEDVLHRWYGTEEE